MLDHPLRAGALNVITRCLEQQLIDAVTQKASLTNAIGTDQSRGGNIALRQPPSVLEGRSPCFYVSRHDPVAHNVNDRDDILLNTGIETAIDRIGPEWHDLSKRAKDMGSAAVLLSLVLCGGIWLAALFQRFGV